jgi:hypothetical protein
MSLDFILGLAALPAAAIAVLLVWFLYALVHRAWRHLHQAMISRITLRSNPYESDGRRKAASTLVDAIAAAPHFWMGQGLGWVFVLVRDTKTSAKKAEHDTVDADEPMGADELFADVDSTR